MDNQRTKKYLKINKNYLKTKNDFYLTNFKIKNMLNDLHDKSIKFLLDRYDVIYLPKF